MIAGANPLIQTVLGTLFTWGLTAIGSGLVFVFQSGQRKILDGSLGFAAGVMTAASYWSLLAPAIEMAEKSGAYGEDGQWAFIPVAIGFVLGAAFVYGADVFMPYLIAEESGAYGEDGQWAFIPVAIGFVLGAAFVYGADVFMPYLMAEISGAYGEDGQWAFIPVAIGFVLGAAFVYGADVFMPYLGAESTTSLALSLDTSQKLGKDGISPDNSVQIQLGAEEEGSGFKSSGAKQRRKPQDSFLPNNHQNDTTATEIPQGTICWRRILLLIIAITIHNIPEGLAVGVGFGAVGKSPSATFENARNLAIGIGIQNFPEGLAVSLPLRGSGMSTFKCFWYGQLSGIVEPIAGLFGVLAVVIAEPILPYALAFAAGAMIYVVVDDIIPEAQTSGNGKLASWTCIVGFVVMMALDVGLG